ncbi:heme o synthase [Candidatus Poriferisodalis sp.]|uniref:heme o synthase n=1 Tax=Candidatus Poriferisodalis sp. TaxID=3101277 RepID=UPI003D0D6CEE
MSRPRAGLSGDVAASQSATAAAGRASGTKLRAYVALTKPRIIELLLVTTVPPMFVAERGVPSLALVVLTVLGGTFAAAGANTFNMVIDRDIDATMARTAHRPLVVGTMGPAEALVYGVVLEAVAFAVLWWGANLLAAVLALAACLFYVFVYSLWLKRTSTQNIVIGGAAGAAPVLVGWAAVSGTLSPAAWIAFAIVFFWTPPHFWALAIRYADDYGAADVPMLPTVASPRSVLTQMTLHTTAVIGLSLWFGAVAATGPVYWITAGAAGAVFGGQVLSLWRARSARAAMAVFHSSIAYLGLVFAAMAADVIVRFGW